MKHLAIALLLIILASPASAQSDSYGEDGLDVLRDAHPSARTAVLMTFPVPGWGQLYADTPFWSVVAFASQSWFLGNALLERRRLERQKVKRDRLRNQVEALSEEDLDLLDQLEYRNRLVEEHRERARDFLWWAGGAYLIISLDAYVSVELATFDSDDPPTPDLERNWGPADEDGEELRLSVNWRF